MISALVRRLGFGRLAENTILAVSWQGVRVLSLALWAIVVARQLGAQGFGNYSGLGGLATTLGGLSGLGLGLVMYQQAARDPAQFNVYWHHALRFTLLSGAALSVAFVLIAFFFLPSEISLTGLVGLGISEIIGAPLVAMAAFAFAAFERIGLSTALSACLALARLLAAVAFMLVAGDHHVNRYIFFHTVAISCSALLSLIMVNRYLAPGRSSGRPIDTRLGEGLGFSAVWSVNTALGSLDKTLVLKLAGSETAGIYSVAYRMATVLALPVEALTAAATPRLFQQGSDQKYPHLLRNLFLATASYALIGCLLLWGAAMLLPIALGSQFEAASSAARSLIFFLPCYAFRLLGSNILLAGRSKRFRVISDGAAILLMSAAALTFVPRFGLPGALWAVTISEVFLASAQWLFIWHTRRARTDSSDT